MTEREAGLLAERKHLRKRRFEMDPDRSDTDQNSDNAREDQSELELRVDEIFLSSTK